jgi:hypothetical protein
VLIHESASVLHVKSVEIIRTRILGKVMKSNLDDEVQRYIEQRKITEDKLARFLFYTLFIHSLIKNKLSQRLSEGEFTITLEELLKVLKTGDMTSEILMTNTSAIKQTDADVQSKSEVSQNYVDKLEKAAALLLSYYNEEELLGESTEETKSDSGQTRKPTWRSLRDSIATTRDLLSEIVAKLASETGVTVTGQGSETGSLQAGDTKKEVSSKAEGSSEPQPKTKAKSEGKVEKKKSKTGEGGKKSAGEITPEQEVGEIDTEGVASEFEEKETVAQIAPSEIGVDKMAPAQCEQIIAHFRDEINEIIKGSEHVEGKKVGFHLTFNDYPVVITIDKMIRLSPKKSRLFPIVKGSIHISVPSLQEVTRTSMPSEVDNLVRAYLWRKETKLSDDVKKPIIVQFSYTLTPSATKTSSGLSFYYKIAVDFGEDLKKKMRKDAGWQIVLREKEGAKFGMVIKSFEEKEEILRGLLPGQRRAFFFRISDDATYIVSFYKEPSFIVTKEYAQAFYDLLGRFIEKLVDRDSLLWASTYLLISKVKKYVERLKREKYSSAGSKNTGFDKGLTISDSNEMMVIYAIASLIESGVLKLETDNKELKEEYELLRDEFEEIFEYLKFMVVPGGSFRFDERKIKTAALVSLKFVTQQLNATSQWLLNMLSKCLLKHISSIIKKDNSKSN